MFRDLTYKITPLDLKQNSELRAQYNKWCEDPYTKMFIGMVRDLSKPRMIGQEFMVMCQPGVLREISAALHDRQTGVEWALDKLVSMDVNLSFEDQTIESDFGAKEILKKQGYKEDEE